MFKKAISILLALMLLVSSIGITAISVAAADGEEETTCVVAGSSEDIFGASWDGTGTGNEMEAKGDGTYEKVYADVQPADNVELKVVYNGEWIGIGEEFKNNVLFNVKEACDVTVKFDPATKAVTVEGTGVELVTDLEIKEIIAVGNGYGTYLNGIGWDPADDTNAMKETEEGSKIYEITFEGCDANDNAQIKFAANGTESGWAYNWGGDGTEVKAGVAKEAVWNGDNIVLEIPDDECTVKVTLDTTNFDFATKKGATYKVEYFDAEGNPIVDEEEETTEPAPEEETTEAAPEEETTVAAEEETEPVAADTFTVKATSNVFPEYSQTFTAAQLAENENKVTVSYFINSEKMMQNAQWVVRYDGNYLTLDKEATKKKTISPVINTGGSGVINFDPSDFAAPNCGIRGNCTDLNLYKLNNEGEQIAFVTVTFNVAEGTTGTTTVDLEVENMKLANLNEDEELDPETEEEFVNQSVVKEVSVPVSTVSSVYGGKFDPEYVNPVVEETTAAPVEETTEEPTTEEPTTEEPTTEEPTTEEATTVAPEADKLIVHVTSNFFPATTQEYPAGIKKLYVAYYINYPDMAIVNSDVTLKYDPEKFDYSAKNTNRTLMPVCTENFVGIVCTPPTDTVYGTPGEVTANFSDINNEVKAFENKTYFYVEFDVADGAKGETTIDLNVKDIRFSQKDTPVENMDPEDKPVTDSVLTGDASKYGLSDKSWTDEIPTEPEVPTTEEPTTEEPTTEEPTTEEPTTEAPKDLTIKSVSNFAASETKTIKVGEETTFEYSFTSPDEFKIISAQFEFLFDSDYIEVTGIEMPEITDFAKNNTPGKAMGNFSDLEGYDFTGGKVFAKITVKGLKDGETEVNMKMIDMLNERGPIYINGDYVYQPEEPTTEEPTTEEPTTEEPTTEEPTTEEPTTEEPTTEEPTTEEPTTEEPTTEEPTTEEPTTEEPTTEAPVTEEPTTESPATEEPTTEAPTQAPTDATSATDAPTTTKPASTSDSTKDSGTSNTTTGTNGAVQTGNASMAVIILLVLVSATGAVYFARKRVK